MTEHSNTIYKYKFIFIVALIKLKALLLLDLVLINYNLTYFYVVKLFNYSHTPPTCLEKDKKITNSTWLFFIKIIFTAFGGRKKFKYFCILSPTYL